MIRHARRNLDGWIALGLILCLFSGTAACGQQKPPAAVAALSGHDEVNGPLGTALDRYLSQLETFGFSGSALVAKDGKIVLNKGYGLADRAKNQPYTSNTIFDIASISKQFTAAAILKLEMEGKLKVEDPITKFFGPLEGRKPEITLHMLLTHTSGMPDVLGDEYEPVSRDEMVKRAMGSALISAPGRKFHYSNAGYNLLAAVVEIVSKQSYETYLREHLFVPAGMLHTGFHVPDRELAAHGYLPGGEWGTAFDHPWLPDGPYWNLRGNGGILTTTGDLYRWHLALQGDTVLSKEEREKFVTPFVSQGRMAHASYAYGWAIEKDPKGGLLISHLGGNLVFESDFRRYMDANAVIITSSNSTEYSAISVSPHLEKRIFGLPDPEPPSAAPVDPALLARRAGIYALPSGDRLQVAAAGKNLAVTALGPQAFSLLLSVQDDEDREGMADRLKKAAEAFDGLRAGNPKPFADLRSEPAAKAAEEAKAVLGPWQEKLGAWKSTEVLGNESYGGHPSTYSRLTFEKGSKVAELGWSGMGVELLRFMDAPPPVLFVPQADGSFASYDVRTGTGVRLAFEDPGGGKPGELVAKTADAPGGTVRARRVE
jgi:CubicO group peptidase (beta-lactamase class C family)